MTNKKTIQCPNCKVEIESDDVAHFDLHKDHEERLRKLEESGNNPPPTDPPTDPPADPPTPAAPPVPAKREFRLPDPWS